MKNTILALLLLVTTTLSAQQVYYNNVDLTLTGMALKAELTNKITVTHTNNLSYSQVWSALKITDLEPGSSTNVYLVYGYDDTDGNVTTDLTRSKNSNGGSVGDWNREHTYPKSLGTPALGTSGPGADAHMLRSCDVQRNGSRGSLKFVDATGTSKAINGGWYPGDQWKGDMARIIMYMYLRYGSRCLPINTGIGNSVNIDPDMIDLFLQWNIDDPVSTYEVTRNNYLGTTSNAYGQGNRNPFIDEPYLATRIWGGGDAEDIWGIYNLSIDDLNLNSLISVYPNPSEGNVTIEASEKLTLDVVNVYYTNGQVVYRETSIIGNNIHIDNLERGFYMVQITTDKGIITEKLIVN
ncbi:MAG TPA: T9SS type A sorting domain-containing protein [Crocinitomicaceae bacterium]|nr:T9SS type A sorting domain-containing protein [Crocinitomicaceae bacterium]